MRRTCVAIKFETITNIRVCYATHRQTNEKNNVKTTNMFTKKPFYGILRQPKCLYTRHMPYVSSLFFLKTTYTKAILCALYRSNWINKYARRVATKIVSKKQKNCWSRWHAKHASIIYNKLLSPEFSLFHRLYLRAPTHTHIYTYIHVNKFKMV